jgi:RNA polymerase sigma-70 factor (ECF subfamily)
MTAAILERAFREERAAVVAAVARRAGDLGLAEDATQEAFAAAAARWPVDGVPERPGAWLTTTAWRKAIDVLRRERRVTPRDEVRMPEIAMPEATVGAVDDDVLALLLACCHPALASEAQVALTLRHVAGLTTREIAAAFLVPESTMAKRLVRARTKIRDAGIRFEVPPPQDLGDRLAEVQAVVYLVFTEGYLASGEGPAVRADLCEEAVWLARRLHRLVPRDTETTALLALLLLQHARAGAREDGGALVPFGDQDPARWDPAAVQEARTLLAATTGDSPGPYAVQAGIALLHATAPAPDRVDWVRVARLYGVLARRDPSPVIEVNRAVAVGRADGARAGLALLSPLLGDPRLAGYAPLLAAHADLLEAAGDPAAAHAWRTAAGAAPAGPQRDQLLRRAVMSAGRRGTRTDG